MERKIIIILPQKIPILRDGKEAEWKRNTQEFNLYFKNMILPYREEYDIRIRCLYGKNLGTFWQLSEYPHDIDSFELELMIYNEYGEKIASKKTTIELYDRSEDDKPYHMLFVGDSMTFAQRYLERIAGNLHHIVFKGSRNVFGHISHEGRGGWSYRNYFNRFQNQYGVSPFLFPKGVDDYLGDIDFINCVNAQPYQEYHYTGFEKQKFVEQGIYGKEGKLYRYEKGEFILALEKPEWEFDFGKYVKRYQIGTIHAVSVLLGANDLQTVTYEDSDEMIEKYIQYTEKFIQAVHQYDSNIDIIINLPIIGADQYSWGMKLGCTGSSKMYRFNIIKAALAILNKYENKSEHIHICPMLLSIDPEHGFPKEVQKPNCFTENFELHHSNWVHPNLSGYYQMGDCLCGTIQKLRIKKNRE